VIRGRRRGNGAAAEEVEVVKFWDPESEARMVL